MSYLQVSPMGGNYGLSYRNNGGINVGGMYDDYDGGINVGGAMSQATKDKIRMTKAANKLARAAQKEANLNVRVPELVDLGFTQANAVKQAKREQAALMRSLRAEGARNPRNIRAANKRMEREPVERVRRSPELLQLGTRVRRAMSKLTPDELDAIKVMLRVHGEGFWDDVWSGIKSVGSTVLPLLPALL